jgi:hypothetical protein
LRKIIITTGCGPEEKEWQEVCDISVPRFKRYAREQGYDFKAVWYDDINRERFPEFWNAKQFIGNADLQPWRKDWILWKGNRSMLSPNWIRYAACMQLLREYDLVVYFDVDTVIADFDSDVAEGFPYSKWLAGPVNGPDPMSAGPGGALWMTRSCSESKEFWQLFWEGKRWTHHPLWTDGIDFMSMLGYSTIPPIRKVRHTRYDRAWYTIPAEWNVYFREHPEQVGKCYHVAGGLAPLDKVTAMQSLIERLEI